MNKINICQDFSRGLDKLFSCTPHGEYQRVRTPYLYPDGDNIDIFCKPADDSIMVSDLGETTRWLRMQSASLRRSPKQNKLINDVCQTHNVDFFKGTIHAQCKHNDSISSVITRVAQAALRISDIWFTMRSRSIESIRDEITDYLVERTFSFTRDEKLVGRSGRSWTVDFRVSTLTKSSLITILSTGSKSAAKSITEHVLATWIDLNQYTVGQEPLQFISLFDDTIDVWNESDFKLLEPFSQISRWSNPDQFADILNNAA